MITPCPQCGESRWSKHGTADLTLTKEIPKDLLEKHEKGLVKIDFEEYRIGFLKTAGFTCKSCGYTIMKDENGNLHSWEYTDIDK